MSHQLTRRRVMQLLGAAMAAGCAGEKRGVIDTAAFDTGSPDDTDTDTDSGETFYAYCEVTPGSEAEGWVPLALSDYPELATVGGYVYQTVGGTSMIVACADTDCYVAMDPRCSHEGVTIFYQPEYRRFKCPLHSSIFTETGEVVGGPALVDLTTWPAGRVDDVVWIKP